VREALKEYSYLRNKWIVAKKCLKNKKIRSPNNNEGNEQVENKKTTTKNKIMQTQQCEKRTRYKWIVAQKCLQKKKKLKTQILSKK
jgi:hypothetical protein